MSVSVINLIKVLPLNLNERLVSVLSYLINWLTSDLISSNGILYSFPSFNLASVVRFTAAGKEFLKLSISANLLFISFAIPLALSACSVAVVAAVVAVSAFVVATSAFSTAVCTAPSNSLILAAASDTSVICVFTSFLKLLICVLVELSNWLICVVNSLRAFAKEVLTSALNLSLAPFTSKFSRCVSSSLQANVLPALGTGN